MALPPSPTRAALFLCVVLLAPTARAQDALQVQAGRCEFVLDTPHPNDHCYLILGSLAPGDRTVRVEVRTEATDTPPQLPLDRPTRSPLVQDIWQEQARKQEQ